MKHLIKYFILFLWFCPLGISAQTKGPREVVVFALNNMTNGQLKPLLDITDGAEKRKTEELIARMEKDPRYKDSLLAEYKLLKSYSIEEVTHLTNEGRILSVVATRWTIKVPLERAPRNLVPGDKGAKSENTVYMDYLLEFKNNSWKIISRRSL